MNTHKQHSWMLAFAGLLGISAFSDGAHAAWPFATGAFQNFSSPVIGDVNGDGKLDMVFTSNGYVYCAGADGNLLWSYLIGNGFTIDSSPTLADVDGNPSTLEILVEVGSAAPASGLYILSSTGQLLLHQSVENILGGVAVADTNNDGEKEIYFGTALTSSVGAPLGGKFYSMKPNGQYNFEKDIGQQIVSTPTIVKLGNRSAIMYQYLPNIYADNSASIAMIQPSGGTLWSYTFPDNNHEFTFATSSPAVVTRDDGSIELIIGTNRGKLYAFKARSGQVLWTKQFPSPIMGSVAVADLDGDNKSEIVFSTTTSSNNIYAVDQDGNTKWTTHLDPTQHGIIGFSSPAIGDLDGDGTLKIVIGTAFSYSGNYPAQLIKLDSQGNIVGSVNEIGTVYSSPALADLDNNGKLEVCYGSYGAYHGAPPGDNNGYYNCLNADLTQFQASSLVTSPIRAPWPMIHHDNKRTGNFLTPQ